MDHLPQLRDSPRTDPHGRCCSLTSGGFLTQHTSAESVPSVGSSRGRRVPLSASDSASQPWKTGSSTGEYEPAPDTDFRGTERFEIVGRLGRGGMSVVHAVLDHRSGRRLALKVLREPRPERLSVLKKEFRRVAGLVHPNLVHMHELFAGPDGTFFTMELIEGRRLWSWVREPHFAERNEAPMTGPRGYGQLPTPMQSELAWSRLQKVA
jgi:serine/threonine protein kinase